MHDRFLIDGADGAAVTVLLAHGAGAGSGAPAMTAIARALAAAGFRVARFDFGYMARRAEGGRSAPPRAEALVGEFRGALDALYATGPMIIGGKSMGGRVASLLADALFAEGRIAGLLCVGYPFHPPGKPETLRTRHLANLTPTLICQGTRDPFGTRAEVAGYALSERIEILWLEDGDHDLKPRKTVTGLTQADHFRTLAQFAAEWSARVAARPRPE